MTPTLHLHCAHAERECFPIRTVGAVAPIGRHRVWCRGDLTCGYLLGTRCVHVSSCFTLWGKQPGQCRHGVGLAAMRFSPSQVFCAARMQHTRCRASDLARARGPCERKDVPSVCGGCETRHILGRNPPCGRFRSPPRTTVRLAVRRLHADRPSDGVVEMTALQLRLPAPSREEQASVERAPSQAVNQPAREGVQVFSLTVASVEIGRAHV